MFFDSVMELGDFERVYSYFLILKDMSDYNYLICLLKWSDYIGDLDNVIKFMEMVKEKVEFYESKFFKVWMYSNLVDYYGYVGRIKDFYEYYLKILVL